MIKKTDKELCDIFADGTTSYGKVNVVMRSEHYVIIRDPGCYWWDNGGKHYGRTTHTLLRQGERWLQRQSDPKRKEWEGRVSKKVLAQALKEAEDALKNEEAIV